MTTAFNIAFVLKADPANAKAGLAEVQTGLNVLSAEAQKANASTNLQARALAGMTAEAIQAGTAHKSLAAAIPSLTGAWTGARTAAGALQGAVAGLNSSIGQQANDFLTARQEAALYQSMLDDVRAQFNPLFAAQRQYEQQLKRISDAEKLGAINAIEAAEARQRAASMVQTGRVGDTNSAYSSMVAPQLFDTGVTAAMGMNPMQIGLQQGTQIVQVMQQMGGGKQALQGIAAGFMSLLNPINLVTIGVVALGAVGIQALMGTSYSKATISADRNQKSFKYSLDKFMQVRGADTIVKQARARKAKNANFYASIEQQYGVPAGVLLAIHGMETAFGNYMGDTNVVSAIATLSYDCRRSDFFRPHLIGALKLVDQGSISMKTLGAKHGELGHTQFLPGNAYTYGVDGDGDGRIDLYDLADAMATTANYLRQKGWKPGKGYQEGEPNFEVIKEWNAAKVYQQAIAIMGARIDG